MPTARKSRFVPPSTKPAVPKRWSFLKKSPDFRRQQLIEATFRSLCLYGETATSVRLIAAQAGLSLGMVRHHFKSKGELIAATYQFVSDRFNAAADEAIEAAGPDPTERLKAMLLVGLRPPILDRDYVRVRNILWSLSDSDEAMRRVHRQTYGRFQARLECLFNDVAAARGIAVRPEEATATAILLMVFLKGVWIEWLIAPDDLNPQKLIERFFPLLMHSLFNASGTEPHMDKHAHAASVQKAQAKRARKITRAPA